MYSKHNNDTIELEAKTSPWSFGLLLPLNKQVKKRVMVLTGVIDPDYQEKLDHYSTMEERKNILGGPVIP